MGLCPHLGLHRKSTWNTGSDLTMVVSLLRPPLPFFRIALVVFGGRGEAHAIAGPSLRSEFLAGSWSLFLGDSRLWSSLYSGLHFGAALIPKESDSFGLFALIFAHDGGPICKQG
jgi:hypothetical protein